MPDTTLLKSLKNLTGFRALFVTVLLGTLIYFDIGDETFPYPHAILYLIVFQYGLTIAYALILRKRGGKFLAYFGHATDVLSSVALIFFTGGIKSWFLTLPLLTVIASAVMLGKNAGYYLAILSSLLYGLLLNLQFYKILPIRYDPSLGEKDFVYNLFSYVLAIYLTAYLIGYLRERLERTAIRLEKSTTSLRDLTLFNREVIESVPTGLFTTDPSGAVTLFNRAAEEITELDRRDVVGRPVGGIFPFLKNLRAGVRFEDSLLAGGERKTIGMTVSALRDSEGGETGFIGVFEDLTEKKRMQEEIRRREKLAAIGEISANMAHEIRNPLASLKGSIEMLREGRLPEDRLERLMSIAVSEMDRLDNIIVEFLNYSRPRPLEIRPFDLHGLLDDTLDMIKSRDDSKNITIIKNYSGGLAMPADAQRLQQVFLNLGLNAVDAMSGKGGSLSVGTEADGDFVRITFRDTGRGIGAEDMGRVFYPFFTTKERGTGLGLSIAYRIVEDHGGTMAVESEEGMGTVFDIFLPRGNGRAG